MPPRVENERNEEQSLHSTKKEDDLKLQAQSLLLHPTMSIPLLNMIDMFCVSLVVPLINQYFLDAGVTSASQRELLSSLYSTSQIIGGLVMGTLLDAKILSRKHSLYLSFLGSSISYGLIVYGGVTGLIVSRVVVGLVKQTSTISTSMIATYTSSQDRATYMGRVTASTTLAFIVGPSFGALLYKNVDKKAPALLASMLFILNFILAAILLPRECTRLEGDTQKKHKDKKSHLNQVQASFKNIQLCFTSQKLGAVIISFLLYNWISRATSYANMANYYEEMFGIETHQRGYVRSYASIISLVFQSFFVGKAMKIFGNEYNAACAASLGLALATLLEFSSSFYLFLFIVCPIVAISNAILRLSLRSLLTVVAPKHLLSSVLAALDVLQNAASVSVPFYRTLVFRILSKIENENPQVSMIGEPSPKIWLKCSFVHWLAVSAILFFLLIAYPGKYIVAGGKKKQV